MPDNYQELFKFCLVDEKFFAPILESKYIELMVK